MALICMYVYRRLCTLLNLTNHCANSEMAHDPYIHPCHKCNINDILNWIYCWNVTIFFFPSWCKGQHWWQGYNLSCHKQFNNQCELTFVKHNCPFEWFFQMLCKCMLITMAFSCWIDFWCIEHDASAICACTRWIFAFFSLLALISHSFHLITQACNSFGFDFQRMLMEFWCSHRLFLQVCSIYHFLLTFP